MAVLQMRESLALETRAKQHIGNQIDRDASIAGYQKAVDDYKAKYKSAIHRPVGPCKTYNCHGLTFAARRTCIPSSEVPKILKDDEYVRVTGPIMPGDIALYTREGDIAHSGIVVRVERETPWILSKWGECHEVVHSVSDCPYNDYPVTYHRVIK